MSSTISLATHHVATTWEWYGVRAAGFVAAGLLILLMLSGIGQYTGLTYRYWEPTKAWLIHKALAYALIFAIALHILFLFLDHYISFSLAQIFIPLLSTYNNKTTWLGLPLGALAVSFGILAMYGVVVIVLSSMGWIETHPKRQRLLHYLSYLVIVLVFLHALYSGSDLRYGVFRLGWQLIGVVLIVAIVIRLWRAGTLNRREV